MKKRTPLPVLDPGYKLIDSHCHLDMESYQNNLEAVLSSAIDVGIQKIITIGIDLDSSQKAVQLAIQYPQVFATVGIHPHSAEEASEEAYSTLKHLSDDKNVVGFGEIGLDYAKKYAPVSIQKKEFSRQLEMAKDLHLPVVIHDREAHQDTLEALKNHGPFPDGGVLHCFSGDLHLAEEILALGFYISIPGIVTFKNASQLQEVVREVPLDRILLETDGPFLAPEPWRGKINTPSFILYTAEKVAHLKEMSLAEIAQQTTVNSKQLFSLN